MAVLLSFSRKAIGALVVMCCIALPARAQSPLGVELNLQGGLVFDSPVHDALWRPRGLFRTFLDDLVGTSSASLVVRHKRYRLGLRYDRFTGYGALIAPKTELDYRTRLVAQSLGLVLGYELYNNGKQRVSAGGILGLTGYWQTSEYDLHVTTINYEDRSHRDFWIVDGRRTLRQPIVTPYVAPTLRIAQRINHEIDFFLEVSWFYHLAREFRYSLKENKIEAATQEEFDRAVREVEQLPNLYGNTPSRGWGGFSLTPMPPYNPNETYPRMRDQRWHMSLGLTYHISKVKPRPRSAERQEQAEN